MLSIPTNLADVQSLVDNQVPESIHLDYKASPALDPKKKDEIAKDVSAFSNSDGGLLVYGVEEDPGTHLPTRIDDGVDPKWNRERLEQVLTSNISPRIEGIEIREFPLSTNNLIICVRVPKSFRGPHQASDKKYYKRFNFSSFPMEHYEIEDTRNRRRRLPPLVSVILEPGILFKLVIRNVGQAPAFDLKFTFPRDIKWFHDRAPRQFLRGITVLPPGAAIVLPFALHTDLFTENDAPELPMSVAYIHGESGAPSTETFQLAPADFMGCLAEAPELQNEIRDISRQLDNLVRAVERISMKAH